MSEWQSKVQFSDLADRYEENELTVNEVGERLAERLKGNIFYATSETLQDLVERLKVISDEDDFDQVMDELYEYGDCLRRIFFS